MDPLLTLSQLEGKLAPRGYEFASTLEQSAVAIATVAKHLYGTVGRFRIMGSDTVDLECTLATKLPEGWSQLASFGAMYGLEGVFEPELRTSSIFVQGGTEIDLPELGTGTLFGIFGKFSSLSAYCDVIVDGEMKVTIGHVKGAQFFSLPLLVPLGDSPSIALRDRSA